MNFHPEPIIHSPPARFSMVHIPSNGSRALTFTAVTVLTLVVVTFLDGWPPTLKRKLWTGFVYMTPSSFIYALEFASRKSRFGVQSATRFGRKDFGNQQAKREALGRILGFHNGQGSTRAAHVRKTSHGAKAVSEYVPLPAGLGNWDNSCYQNTVIQSLASLPAVKRYVAMNMDLMSSKAPQPTHQALMSIIDTLNDPESNGRRLWIPPALKSMNSWQQQDAQEYFSRVTDEVDNELASFLKKQPKDRSFQEPREKDRLSIPRNPFHGLLAQRVGCPDCGFTEGLSLLPFTCLTVSLENQRECDIRQRLDDYTALEAIEGVECIKCTVIRTQASLEKVLSNIDDKSGSKPGGQSIEPLAALKQTVTSRLETINGIFAEGDFSDPAIYSLLNVSTKGRVTITKSKQAVIARAPENLAIHVNRSIFDSAGYQRKNNAPVRFPTRLDLSRWCIGSNCADTDDGLREIWETNPERSMLAPSVSKTGSNAKIYELRALITHYGLHEDGHYVAYRKTASEDIVNGSKSQASWFGFSDHIVFPVSEEDVFSLGGVFMLFYEAVTPCPTVAASSTPEVITKSIDNPTSEPIPTEVVDEHHNENVALPSTTVDISESTAAESPTLSSGSMDHGKPLTAKELSQLPHSPKKDSVPVKAGLSLPSTKSGPISVQSPAFVVAQ